MAENNQQQIREQLLAERSRLERDIYERTQGDQAVAAVDPLLDSGGVSSHQADNADAVSEFERNQAIIANSRLVLRQVQAALARLDTGTYGVCERCGKPIEPRRLERCRMRRSAAAARKRANGKVGRAGEYLSGTTI